MIQHTITIQADTLEGAKEELLRYIGKTTKVEMAQAILPAPTEAPAPQEEPTEPEPTDAPDSPAVRAALAALRREKGAAAAKEILQRHGVEALSKLPVAEYAAVIQEAQEAMQQ